MGHFFPSRATLDYSSEPSSGEWDAIYGAEGLHHCASMNNGAGTNSLGAYRWSFNLTLLIAGVFGMAAGGAQNFVALASLLAVMGTGAGGIAFTLRMILYTDEVTRRKPAGRFGDILGSVLSLTFHAPQS